ncbi:MAG: phosphatase PAP2 family protein [Acidobacteriota bacterium]|nr:phosphatase PAP2 family protein [Acidobacteriota bacterium]
MLRTHQSDVAVTRDVRFSNFFGTLAWNVTEGLFSSHNLMPVLIGGAGALAVYPVDMEISDHLIGEAAAVGHAGHAIGHPMTTVASVLTSVVAAQYTQNRRFRGFAYTLAQAQILDSTLKYVLKGSISRTRPSGENDNSFPSGHTSTTLTLATVAASYYGYRVAIPAYAAAAFVGLSRLERGKHFPSDIVFGATLGYIAGRTAIRGTERSLLPEGVTIAPVVSPDRAGLLGSWKF